MTHNLCPQGTQSSTGRAGSKLGGGAEGLSWGGGDRKGVNVSVVWKGRLKDFE